MSHDSRRHSKYLTKKEQEYFEAMGRFDTMKAAAAHLGIDPQTLYNWKSNKKKQYKFHRGRANALLAQTKRGGCLANFLTERKKMAPPDSEEDEEIGL